MNKNKLFYGLLISLLLVSFIITNFIGPNKYRKVIIDGDGSGLYAYLPALFIYKSIDFTPVFEFEKSRRAPDYMGHYFHKSDDILVNKYTSGTALLQLPFFLLAYILSLIFGLEADGYNILFQYGVAFSALCWVFAGLVFFVKLARLYKIKQEIAWLLAFGGFIGTNLFYYTLVAPAASHVYSFSLISIFLYFIKRSFMDYHRRSMYMASLLLALIMLVRPANVLIVMVVPFLSGSFTNLFFLIKKKLRSGDILILILIFIIGISPQLIINFMQTGQTVVYGYTNEGFYFTKPQTLEFLFSFQKGWFVYTPFMLLIIPALIVLYQKSKIEFYSFIFFLMGILYVFSSWWNWFYGDSFGMRPMIDLYSLFFLLIALLVASIKRNWLLISIAVFSGLTISLNLIQTIQYAKGIIHPDSMNREAYWRTFLKTSDNFIGIVSAGDEYYYGEIESNPFFETKNDLESAYPNWSNPDKTEQNSYSGSYSMQMDEMQIYSPAFTFEIPEALVGKRNLYVIFSTMILQNKTYAANKALFVADISDKAGKTVFYKKFKVKKLPDRQANVWEEESIGFKLPLITSEMKKIKFYIWNIGKDEVMVDDLSIQFYEYN
ncbi:MAG: hypothetical protein KQH67_08970 [Bacteroidetes bacterium]|nr:hypothetical protein [Bacteroidota bacterium]